ncbi:hypothetical protein EV182_002630, partial [Spiromyces aspiralis]
LSDLFFKYMDFTKCEGPQDFETKTSFLKPTLTLSETEDTWGNINDAIAHLSTLISAYKGQSGAIVSFVQSISDNLSKYIMSERSRLSGSGVMLVEVITKALGRDFAPLCEPLVPAIVVTCGRTNKVFVTRGVRCLSTIISYSHIPDQLPRFCESATEDSSKIMRLSMSKVVLASIEGCTVNELTPFIPVLERTISKGIVDADSEVRKTFKSAYEAYRKKFPDMIAAFNSKLSPIAQKYLGIKTAAPVAAGNSDGKPNPASRFMEFRKRVPLRERLAQNQMADPDNKQPAKTDKEGSVHRLRPIRPPPAVAPARPQPKEQTTTFNNVERLLMSPGGRTPALPKLFGDMSPSVSSSSAGVEGSVRPASACSVLRGSQSEQDQAALAPELSKEVDAANPAGEATNDNGSNASASSRPPSQQSLTRPGSAGARAA